MTAPKLLLKHSRFITLGLSLIGLILMLAIPTIASDLPEPTFPTIEPSADGEVKADFVGWCPSNANICRVNRSWTVDELKAQLGMERWKVWQEDDQLIFAFRGHVAQVFVAGGIYTELIPIENSDYWVATIQVRSLNRAVVSYVFGVHLQSGWQMVSESYGVWRGDRAPDAPELSTDLQGRYETDLLYSPELDELRLVSHYLPPNYSYRATYPVLYTTDGESLGAFAQVIEPLIVNKVIPPMILVGVHSAPFEQTRNRRAEEYILGLNSEAYLAHEQFFTYTVRRWAELRLGASQDPSERAVMGYSNGAVFVGNTAVRQPDLYGHVMMFSTAQQPLVNLRSQVKARFYLNAGTLEPPFYQQAQRFHFTLLLINVDSRFRQRVAGHDFIMWQEELPHAIQWMFTDSN